MTPAEKTVLSAIKKAGSVTTLDNLASTEQQLLITTLYELWGAGLLDPEVLADCTRFTLNLRGEQALELM